MDGREIITRPFFCFLKKDSDFPFKMNFAKIK